MRRLVGGRPSRGSIIERPWRGYDVRLLHFEQLHVEDQRRVGRYHATRAARAVSHVRRNDQRALTTHFHADHTFIPSLDHLACAEDETERYLAVERAIELLSFAARLSRVIKPPGVMHDHRLARLSFGAGSLFYIGFLQRRDCGTQLALSSGGGRC